MFLNSITLKEIQPCTAQGNRIKIKADLSDGISEVFPYLNAVIASSVYNKNSGWLTYRIGEKIVTLYADRLTVTKLNNETDAYETLDIIQEKINEIYESKQNIKPSDEMKKMPTPVDVFKLLPKSNCKKCGEMTCMAFGGKVLLGNAELESCTEIVNGDYDQNYYRLKDMLQTFGIGKESL